MFCKCLPSGKTYKWVPKRGNIYFGELWECRDKSFGANTFPVAWITIRFKESGYLWVCLDVLCGSVGGWSGWVGKEWQEGPCKYRGLHNYCKNRTATASPDLQPCSDQNWPWQRRIILWRWIQELLVNVFSPYGLCFLFFFFKEPLCGFLARQMTATACRIPEPSKHFLDSAILMYFLFLIPFFL